ncbi:MAG TPA: hypothetical protein VJ953_21740 [Saprospiraceae bacterium]|nr:hypothetical protein [Saprospiraceae bacterium]
MKRFRRGILLFHFAVVLFTVAHLHEVVKHPLVTGLLDTYSSFSYTNRCFGFFSPGVNDDLEVHIKAYGTDTTRVIPAYFPGDNYIQRLRVRTMFAHFAENVEESTMGLYSRGWGLYIINQNPEVQRVDILVQQNGIPSMAAYREGQRIVSSNFYSTQIETIEE